MFVGVESVALWEADIWNDLSAGTTESATRRARLENDYLMSPADRLERTFLAPSSAAVPTAVRVPPTASDLAAFICLYPHLPIFYETHRQMDGTHAAQVCGAHHFVWNDVTVSVHNAYYWASGSVGAGALLARRRLAAAVARAAAVAPDQSICGAPPRGAARGQTREVPPRRRRLEAVRAQAERRSDRASLPQQRHATPQRASLKSSTRAATAARCDCFAPRCLSRVIQRRGAPARR
eukprot:scaffold862_cov52-Phaeocystis_antarctica.AAC.3